MTCLFLLLGLGCSHAVKSRELREKATLVSIVDGDTIHVTVSGQKEKIRLIGIDTPESRYSKKAQRDAKRSGNDLKAIYEMGKKSTEYLRKMISPGDLVFLEFDVERREKNGSRTLAYVFLPSGEMINETLVESGYALPYTFPPNVKYQRRFQKAADNARANKSGLWQ